MSKDEYSITNWSAPCQTKEMDDQANHNLGAMSSIFSSKIRIGAHRYRNPEVSDESVKAVFCWRFHRDDEIGLVSS